jgi:hypothetical protein
MTIWFEEQGHQAQEQEQEQEQPPRIYSVTDGLRSSHTKTAYRLAFTHFIKTTVKNEDLQALLDYKPRVIESKIIGHIEHLRYVEKLSYWTIQVHCAAIFHFFEMNDVSINRRKIKRFLPPDESEHSDRHYTVGEIGRILGKCGG